MSSIVRWLLACALVGLWTAAGTAQVGSGPVYVEPPRSVPRPVDRPFDGLIALRVDATDIAHRIFTVEERITVPGSDEVTLLYPRWEPASHGPSLTVTDLAGLSVRAGDVPVSWRRDGYEPHAFRLALPPGVRTFDVRFQIIAGGDVLTPDVVSVPWQRLVLYPAGWYARDIPIVATLTLPAGLRFFSSLDVAQSAADTIRFDRTTLENLLDAPVLAGRYASRVPLTAGGDGAVTLDVVAPWPADAIVPPERLAELRRLIGQLRTVFGPAPFARYEILTRLSEDASAGGTEHRSSSEEEFAVDHFRDWSRALSSRDLIAHEIVHAWNGFYRVPSDLWAPTPNAPVAGSLLWVYEGQTEFWGRILATRAGQFTSAELRDRLAIDAAEVAFRPGRAWRPLSDDVNYPSFMLRQSVPWRDWQRRRDYYSEGVLLWLAVDAELRERSGGRRGIDDFARRFFAGAQPGAPARPYTFADLCRALADTAPGDWAGFLQTWLDAHDELDTNRGLTRHGWRLTFSDTPTAAFRVSEDEAGVADLSYSIGLAVTDKGSVRTVAWNGPAFRAGLRPGATIVAVDGAPFDRAALLAAVRASSRHLIALTVEQDGRRAEVPLAYTGGLRYPRLERLADRPDTLSSLLAPR